MRPFVLATGLLLTLIVGVNAAATWDRWRNEERLRQAAAALGPGRALLGHRDTDERRFQKARLAVIPPPRVVAFGSSRIMTVSTEMVGAAPGEFYNAGISGGSVEDFIVLWSVLRETGRVPRLAIFSLDNWSFNASHPEVKWLAWADDVTRFVDEAGGGWSFGPLAQRVLYRWYQTKELVSFSVLRSSLRELERLRLGRERHGADLVRALEARVVPEADVGGQRAWRPDGSLVYERDYEERPRAAIQDDALDFATRARAGLGAFAWNGERARRLELLWRDMRRHDVAIVAYLPPYHPAVWEAVRREPGALEGLAATDAFLERTAAAVGARVVDLSDPARVPCTAEEFLDGSHARRSCLERLLARLVPRARP